MSGISVASLSTSLASNSAPLLIDVRRREAFVKDTKTAAGALRRDPEQVASWAPELPAAGKVVVYCVHGHEVSQNVAKALREQGRDAAYLEGGIADWLDAGGAADSKPGGAATRWVTRERPKIELAPQAPGLAAISLGLSRNFPDDHEMLKHGMVMYDALYRWCKEGHDALDT